MCVELDLLHCLQILCGISIKIVILWRGADGWMGNICAHCQLRSWLQCLATSGWRLAFSLSTKRHLSMWVLFFWASLSWVCNPFEMEMSWDLLLLVDQSLLTLWCMQRWLNCICSCESILMVELSVHLGRRQQNSWRMGWNWWQILKRDCSIS